MSEKKRLSPTQEETLRQMAESRLGVSEVPSGYSSAGRDASRWSRTMAVLQGHGFVRRVSKLEWHAYEITPEGRDAVKEWRK